MHVEVITTLKWPPIPCPGWAWDWVYVRNNGGGARGRTTPIRDFPNHVYDDETRDRRFLTNSALVVHALPTQVYVGEEGFVR